LIFILTACLASYATETVMQLCHGQRKCNLLADSNTFGKPCKPESRMYLKVVYTCGKKTFTCNVSKLFVDKNEE
jgi:hypothetical protein